MTTDQALSLMATFLRTVLYITAPLLSVSLIAGVVVGIIQTATQINEPSISFLVKVATVVVTGVVLGAQLGAYAIDYTRACFGAIAGVVH
ncbi:MAG: flagellar biosynthetic protein FliQ [Polyangiaceae bacterium]|jgi:flagellar biosynthetic protein FliQ